MQKVSREGYVAHSRVNSLPNLYLCVSTHAPRQQTPYIIIQVSEAGEVVYAFDRDFVSTIRRRSWVQRLRPLWKRVVKGANYLTRVAFGTALIVSALVVWLGVIALMSSGRDNDRCGLICMCVCVGYGVLRDAGGVILFCTG